MHPKTVFKFKDNLLVCN